MADLMDVETPLSCDASASSDASSSCVTQRVMTAGEVGWLFSVRRTPMIMYRMKNDCAVDYYHIPLDRLLKYDHASVTIGTTVRCGISREGVVEIENEDVVNMKLKKLVGYLEGRLITGVDKVSDLIITVRDDGEEIFADDVLLDVRSVFLLLKNRYSKESASLRASNGVQRCVQLAMEGTMKYLSDVVRHFGNNFVMVEMFLSSNAANLELELDYDYRGGKVTAESREASVARSREYFGALRECVSLMR